MKVSPSAIARYITLTSSGWVKTASKIAGSRTELRHPLYHGAVYIGVRGSCRYGRTYRTSKPASTSFGV